jgi:hypothetical protein
VTCELPNPQNLDLHAAVLQESILRLLLLLLCIGGPYQADLGRHIALLITTQCGQDRLKWQDLHRSEAAFD